MADMVGGGTALHPIPVQHHYSERILKKKKTRENEKYLGAHQPLKTQLPQMISIKNK